MIHQIKVPELLNNKRISLICVFILIAASSAGVFFEISMENEDRHYLSEVLLNQLDASNTAVLLLNIILMLLIFSSGLSVYGFPFSLFILFTKAFSIGFCISLVSYSLSSSGMTLLHLSFIFSNIIIAFTYTLAALAVISYALPQMRNVPARSDSRTQYLITFAFLTAAVIIASLLI